MPNPRTKRKRERKINTAQLNTKHGSVVQRGICYLLNSLLHLLPSTNPITPQSLMHELPLSLSSSLQVIWPLWFGQDWNDCERRPGEVRSVLAYWSEPHRLCSSRRVALVLEKKRVGVEYFLHHCCRAAGPKGQLWFIFSYQRCILKHWHKYLHYFSVSQLQQVLQIKRLNTLERHMYFLIWLPSKTEITVSKMKLLSDRPQLGLVNVLISFTIVCKTSHTITQTN